MTAQLLNNLKWFSDPDTCDMGIINHTITHGTSFLAFKVLEEDHAQTVCQSGAGFYIGCTDERTGEPVARDSVEYWATREEAQTSLDNKSWTQRLHA